MGICCGTNKTDEEIEAAQNVEDIITILSRRIDAIKVEGDQIKRHLVDKTVEVDAIDVEGIERQFLEQRVPYLEKIEKEYGKIIIALKNNSGIDLQKAKDAVSDVTYYYGFTYDPNGDLDKAVERFNKAIVQNI